MNLIRIVGTILAGLLGLAFGSFLNVCLSRWPEGESVVAPRSHCRNCGRTLAWWENIPLVSWIALRARCRTCNSKISWRYPLVELLIGILWSAEAFRALTAVLAGQPDILLQELVLVAALGQLIFLWVLIALAILDVEHLWLPNWLTLPTLALGIAYKTSLAAIQLYGPFFSHRDFTPVGCWDCVAPQRAVLTSSLSAVAAAALILLIRWTYWLIRRREGIGLGDAKLMAMLGAWLGLSGALLSFAIGVMLGALFALIALAVPAARRESNTWLAAKLPLGTFLCIGGIISTLWGQPIINAYLHWAGF